MPVDGGRQSASVMRVAPGSHIVATPRWLRAVPTLLLCPHRQPWRYGPLRDRLASTNTTKREETMKAFLRLPALSAAADTPVARAGAILGEGGERRQRVRGCLPG